MIPGRAAPTAPAPAASSDACVLELEGVVAGYGGARVLQGVDLKVRAGSITCIVGPNGAGKSTLLKTVSGVCRVLQGRVVLRGRTAAGGAPAPGRAGRGGAPGDVSELHRLTPAQILARGVAQVPQQNALFPSLSVKENVLMGAYILRRQPALVRRRYREVEDIIPLVRDRASDKAGNLSGGQRRAVEFARSLMLDPLLVLLDEPSLGLDQGSLKQVWRLIADMRDRGCSVLLVEQNVRLGLGAADDGVVMESGRVRLCGSAGDVLANPEIADLYLGGTVRDG